jgi:hypothetical protein
MLPTAWNVYNLKASPFWQDALDHENAARPMSLFVGRHAELAALRDGIIEAGERGSRQAVAGELGVGKTTLVKALKAEVHDAGYLTVNDFVPVVGDDTTTSLIGRIIAVVYETILANRPATHDNAAMQAAELLVRSTRVATGGGGLSAAGFGFSATKGVMASTPKDLMYDGPRVLRDLMALVRSSDALGLVLHMNNLENLSTDQATRSATEFRDLRDLVFMHDGLHVVVVGTPDAIQDVVVAHEQVRNIFSVRQIAPLTVPEVRQLLAARYTHLQLDTTREVIAPIDDTVVALLVDLYRGDLRGVLKALDDGVRPNIGLAYNSVSADSVSGVQAVGVEALRATLRPRYGQQLAQHLETRRVEQLTQWGARAPDTLHTQTSLRVLWKLGQSAVSIALTALIANGYVVALPRQGKAPIQYALSGTSRLVFG